jgi:class 3 adenylate cyclase
MIDAYIEAGGVERAEIAARIERNFSVEGTILSLDISGFSRLTAKHGVIHYLAMVRRMQRVTSSFMERHKGEVIKYEADNLFALFETVDDAILFALEVRNAFEGMNVLTEDDSDIHVCIGIASGSVLVIEGKDAWGGPMNLASKLGEDIAGRGEILVHEESFATSSDRERYLTQAVSYNISAITIPAVHIEGIAK